MRGIIELCECRADKLMPSSLFNGIARLENGFLQHNTDDCRESVHLRLNPDSEIAAYPIK